MKHRPELDEYTPNAAARTRAADCARLARQRQQAEARAAEQRRSVAEEARQQARPIEDGDELAQSVEQLAGAWGLKKKRKKATRKL